MGDVALHRVVDDADRTDTGAGGTWSAIVPLSWLTVTVTGSVLFCNSVTVTPGRRPLTLLVMNPSALTVPRWAPRNALAATPGLFTEFGSELGEVAQSFFERSHCR